MARHTIKLESSYDLVSFKDIPINSPFWLYEVRDSNGKLISPTSPIIVGIKFSANEEGYNAYYITATKISPVFIGSDYMVSPCKSLDITIRT